MSLLDALKLTYVLFVLYLAYCTLRAAQRNGKLDAAPFVVRAVCYSVLVVTVILDVIFNATVGSLVFLDPPRQWTFTARCKRHMHEPGRRGAIARWVCEGWLNPFDAGHC